MSLEYVEAVHLVAARIRPGSVLTYGDIAELLGAGGPRQVGSAMAGAADGVPWWRVLRADGTLPAGLHERALPYWQHEGMPLRNGRVRLPAARWQPGVADFAAVDALATDLLRPPAGPEPKRRGDLL